MSNIREITLYVIGENEADAKSSPLFDDFYSARDWVLDGNPGNIYAVTALINFDTLEHQSSDLDEEDEDA